jgi:hypothetical protein
MIDKRVSEMHAAARAYPPPDGVVRPAERQREINAAFAAAFDGAAGKLVLETLQGITAPLPRGYDDATVRERNAMAWLVSVIETRIEHGRHGLPRPE